MPDHTDHTDHRADGATPGPGPSLETGTGAGIGTDAGAGTATGAGGDADAFRALLRGLRVWEGELPSFDPEGAPGEPLPLFRQWLREAAEAGVPEPHTMSLATADAAGDPSVRIVMLHDADERGWHFGTHRGSRKGRELAVRPRAALAFYWAAVGRQVRVRGTVAAASPEESVADLHRRSTGALAAALVGHQSEVLGSAAELARTADAAWERARREPDAPVPSWTLYVLRADEVEFFQGDQHRRQHVRLNYRRTEDGWERELLWP
ncbi:MULTISPECIES: pyridoxal 5'-phosphate synthase [unclassified Streptomyces]|uniref:pyridoxine/pyridoxamine 5'-phosphate oxidase n=1 Tax=unclassified Streptomyces TaxID=2593676 RepID=UPI0003745F53|nr:MULTISPECIES: pyridoxal 5'-phosphate synthase [unclassified Streptomyces]MYT31085.1 pyridoxamine 5'-phosphate oxidase [Streptomyces sp. SID8354]